ERGTTRITYGSRERRDLLGAVDWLLAHGYVPGTIGVLGVSIGAVAGIDAANREPAIGALMDGFGTNSHAYHQYITRFFCCALAGRHTPHVGDSSTGDADRNTRSA